MTLMNIMFILKHHNIHHLPILEVGEALGRHSDPEHGG